MGMELTIPPTPMLAGMLPAIFGGDSKLTFFWPNGPMLRTFAGRAFLLLCKKNNLLILSFKHCEIENRFLY